jgi:hypothetical protein
MWEVWKFDGQYIQGKLLKKYKSKENAIKYAKKTIKYKKTSSGKKDEIYLEDKDGLPIGMIIQKKKK